MKPFLVLCIVISLANACPAATYYVAQQATNAADTNAGTESQPFKTIGAAVANIQPGDTVLVKNGTYREGISHRPGEIMSPNNTDPVQGLPQVARITLAAYPAHRPVIKGSEIVTNRFEPVRIALRQKVAQAGRSADSDPQAWLKVIGAAGLKVDRDPQALPPGTADEAGFDDARAPFSGIYACSWETYSTLVFIDEEPLRQIGLQGNPIRAKNDAPFTLLKQWDGKDVRDLRPGTFYYDEKAKRLYVWSADGSNPNRRVVEASVRSTGIRFWGTWTVDGFDVRHVQDGSMAVDICGMSGLGRDIIIQNCRITHNGYCGLIVQGEDNVVRGNELAWNGVFGFTDAMNWRLLFENNVVHNNNWTGGLACGAWNTKLHQSKDARILRNHFYDEGSIGLWQDINVCNILVAENVFERLSTGTFFEICRWGIFVNNVFRNCSRGVMLYASDVLVAHNVFDGCAEAITIEGRGPAGCCNYRVNFFEKNDRAPDYVLMAVRNNLIVNNLIIDSVSSCVGAGRDDASNAGNFSDYNAFAWTLPQSHVGAWQVRFMTGWNETFDRLPSWRQKRHYDEHSVIADPLLLGAIERGETTSPIYNMAWLDVRPGDVVGDAGLVNRGAGDYRLKADSPLRGRGIALPPVLNAVYVPAKQMETHSRAWAWTIPPTNSASLPAVSFKMWDHTHYRIQPLPQIRPMVDLDGRGPADPGINLEWQRTGRYPRFRSDVAPETAADDLWCVFPMNHAQDIFFEQPFGEVWKLVQGMATLQRGEARAELSVTNTGAAIAQKIGTIRPDTDYVLWADMQVESLATNGTAVGEIVLAAGPGAPKSGAELAPIQMATVSSAGGLRRHWRTHSVYYKSGAATNDAHVGKDLYVVMRANGNGLSDGTAPAAVVRWNNVHLSTGELMP